MPEMKTAGQSACNLRKQHNRGTANQPVVEPQLSRQERLAGWWDRRQADILFLALAGAVLMLYGVLAGK